MAFTTPDSQSGYQAMRTWLAPHARARGAPLFGAMVGPLVTPRRVVEAVVAGEADAGPVDSYALDLLLRHAPALTAPLAVIAETPPTPMPPLVGAAGLPAADASRLTRSLCAVAAAPALAAVRDTLLLRGFARVAASDYASLRDAAHRADALGYPALR
jgi:ABC-type phosphate/phosphonate transport system substrate-binding protein